ncbi:FadR/GntR family transcriptional regulator [Salsuginibacillus kocurii]|uniref:FadR/GntR family transcriptional regulator n=1 Tax=Salsuginibacillus kocurii TaxID=427078 RepID=UPI0003643B17|nr:FadR/GntR family transcriptional regulator [Salsuginibacillus kocurii]
MFKQINEDKVSHSHKVVEHIQDLIIRNELKPDKKLPAERDLAIKMNVSRPTIREAYKILSALGFIKIKHGQGVFVQNHKHRMEMFAGTFFSTKDSILELFEIRKTLEPEAAYWGAMRGTNDQLEKLYQNVLDYNDQVHASNEAETISLYERADHDFHSLVAECAQNMVYESIMSNLILLLKKGRTRALMIPGRSLTSMKEHYKVAEAMIKRKPEEAREAMLNHLNSVETTLIRESDKS